MRGDIVYRVYGQHEGRAEDYFFGAFRTVAGAEAHIVQLLAKESNGANWAAQYHNRSFVIREHVVTTDFTIPTTPKPRERYFVKGTPRPNQPGTWDSTIVEVFRRGEAGQSAVLVASYVRHFSLLHTFEPFRQGSREYALVSCDYTRTAVLDLQTNEIIAEEEANPMGFCPVGFYVPEWWDVHDGSIIPGSEYWRPEYETPTGQFGFVWGCIWGDDSAWKVQYLDLSRVQEGIIQRDERFGYLELATSGYRSPCFDEAPPTNSRPPSFINVGNNGVTFAVKMSFDLTTGQNVEWQRLRVLNLQ